MTAEEFVKLHGDESNVELVKGRVVRYPMPGAEHGEVCGNAYALIREHVRPSGPGRLREPRPHDTGRPAEPSGRSSAPVAVGSGRDWVPAERERARVRDDEQLQRGLAQLVLTVTELLRDLMERQALRRVEAGTLEPERVERLGRAFERLEQQMAELKRRFELRDDDLTLRLGPLTDLDGEDA